MSETRLEESPPRPGRRRWLVFLPLALFGLVAVVFFVRLLSGIDPSRIPSVLVGKPAPALALEPLPGSGVPAPGPETLAGKVGIVNVFASWCVPCRQEHPFLLELSRRGDVALVGINYKDDPDNATGFLQELGNPYDAIGVDPKGRAVIDWGVYGIPETFLIGRDGTILYKHIGPFTQRTYSRELLPRLEEALAP